MKLDINEIPALDFDVATHGSTRAESAKVIPAIIIGFITSKIISDHLED